MVQHVVVVGAGVVGLSTAWFLQERGAEVTVVDRRRVAAGASWGNAGWVSPGLAIPLNEPATLRYGLRSLLDRDAPLHVPATADPRLWSFLATFAAHCTQRSWDRAVRANLPLNEECHAAFDALADGGVDAPTTEAPITAVFESSAQAGALVHELDRLAEAGQKVDYTTVGGDELRELVPQATARITMGVRLDGQRYVDPGWFTESLARSVVHRGGDVRHGFDVRAVRRDGPGLIVRSASGAIISAGAVVVATGAWLGKRWGVKVPVRAGRGYSFTVPTDEPVVAPVYLPHVRVACTPYHGGLRVAGTMEFRGADAALDPRRIHAIVRSVKPLLGGVRWEERTDEWVGPRPVSGDGRPLIGETREPGLFVVGGHGMWGLTHGPVTGRLLAEQITTGRRPAALRDFAPTR